MVVKWKLVHIYIQVYVTNSVSVTSVGKKQTFHIMTCLDPSLVPLISHDRG